MGSMQVREKADFLLEQVRLCLAKNDFVRAQIIANKIKVCSQWWCALYCFVVLVVVLVVVLCCCCFVLCCLLFVVMFFAAFGCVLVVHQYSEHPCCGSLLRLCVCVCNLACGP